MRQLKGLMWINYLLLGSLSGRSSFFSPAGSSYPNLRSHCKNEIVMIWSWCWFFFCLLTVHHHKQSRGLLMIIICSLKCYFLLSSCKRDYLPSDSCQQKPTWSLMISFWKGGERFKLRLRMAEIKRPKSAYWIEEDFSRLPLQFHWCKCCGLVICSCRYLVWLHIRD